MYWHVLIDALLRSKSFIANFTSVVLDIRVNVQMICKIPFRRKRFRTQIAFELLIILFVTLHMRFQVSPEFEDFIAHLANIILPNGLLQMALFVVLDRFIVIKHQATNIAGSRSVHFFYMVLQAKIKRFITAILANS